MKLPECPGLLLEERSSGVLHVIMNSPRTLNSFDDQRYIDLIAAFEYAKQARNIKAIVLSAKGRYFSAGAALSADRLKRTSGKPAPISSSWVLKLVDALIDFPKLAVAVVQGPAYGIAVTILALFDLVYASSTVTLTTPFSSLGICLEGCSSVTFPALLGQPLSTRLLYLAETVPIEDLRHTQLIADILPVEGIQETALARFESQIQGLYLDSIIASKGLVRSQQVRKTLHEVNRAEMTLVSKRMASEDHIEAIKRFQEKKNVKKAAAKL